MTILNGVITRFDKKTGTGRVKIDGVNREVFFHKDEVGLNTHKELTPGRIVACQVRNNGPHSSSPDKLKAVNILIVMEGKTFLTAEQIAALDPASSSNIQNAGNKTGDLNGEEAN